MFTPGQPDISHLYRRHSTSFATASFTAFVKSHIPLFLLFIGERSLKSSSLKFPSFLVLQLSPQGREICETLPSLMLRQVSLGSLRSRKAIRISFPFERFFTSTSSPSW